MAESVGMDAKPSPQLTRAARAYRNAEASLQLARSNLHAAIAEDLRAGVRQAELVKATGYTRELIRRVAREAGIPAA